MTGSLSILPRFITTRNYVRTGLGTYISRALVELMGGKIWFESKPKVGSTSHFTVPVYSCSLSSRKDDNYSYGGKFTIECLTR